VRLHHVQVSCPSDGEDAARRFYGAGLGLSEVEKPPALAGRGGCWFRDSPVQGPRGAEEPLVAAVEVHVGVEQDFRPARKAHPAFLVDDLEPVAVRLEELGFEVDRTEADTLPGYLRFHTADGNGNRVEVMVSRQ
jgi:catechol 2,3-dioxygenase-like lactoylglutathione lyase family enzyme